MESRRAGVRHGVQIGSPGAWQTIAPTTTWTTMQTTLRRDNIQVATDRYYINVAVTPRPAT
jgi:hypothetical protein